MFDVFGYNLITYVHLLYTTPTPVMLCNMTALLGEVALFIRVMSAFLQLLQAILTALHRDNALLRPPCWGAPTVTVVYS